MLSILLIIIDTVIDKLVKAGQTLDLKETAGVVALRHSVARAPHEGVRKAWGG